MRLIELYDRLVAKADEEERRIADWFREHIEALDPNVAPPVPHQEYPKWVGDVVVESAEEEAVVRARGAADVVVQPPAAQGSEAAATAEAPPAVVQVVIPSVETQP